MASLESIRFAQAEDTADAGSPAEAARSAWGRVDRLGRKAPTRERWDCRAGCAACCRLQVFVHPLEADAIAAIVRERFPVAEREIVERRIAETAARARGLDAGAWRRARLACAFLDDRDRCRIYDARPSKCRAHVSRDVSACESPTSPVPLDDWLVKVAEAVLHGLGEAVQREELHASLAVRLAGPHGGGR